jgi:hypothetical protein
MKKSELFSEYRDLVKQGKDIDNIILYIHMPTGEQEVIVNPNVDQKMQYIDKTYNDDLIHANCKDIYITEAIFGMADDGMDFGDAIGWMREDGCRVARKGWNGKGMFLYYVPASRYEAFTDVAKGFAGKDGKVEYGAYIAMKTASGNVVPWLASQTDMLADDWYVLSDYLEEVGADAAMDAGMSALAPASL